MNQKLLQPALRAIPLPIPLYAAVVALSVVLIATQASPTWIFLAATLSLLPLALLVEEATEELSRHFSSYVGSMLHGTSGNLAGLVLSVIALRHGRIDLIRSSWVGAIVTNLLLVLGLAILCGGIRHRALNFSRHQARLHVILLTLSVIAVVFPSLFFRFAGGMTETGGLDAHERLSYFVCVLLLGLYVAGLVFTLTTHHDLVHADEAPDEAPDAEPGEKRDAGRSHAEEHPRAAPRWSAGKALLLLAGAAMALAWECDKLVDALDHTLADLRLSEHFVGVVLASVIGSFATAFTAVRAARENQMGVALEVSVGASCQIALLVLPLLVFLSIGLGHPMHFIFERFDLVAIGSAVWIASVVAATGRAHWFQGLVLVVVFAIAAGSYYFLPD